MSNDILKGWVTEGDAVEDAAQRRQVRQAQGGPLQTVYRRGGYARGRFDQLRRAAEARKAEDADNS